ncbi:MAG: AAA family ATPase, partial [Desulfobulbaceae bacterium]|nr:AAA family ATPase [Desulfobulbaceae bacterium]
MYNTFFGLKEKPFKLVPNPAYLFLSKSHEEALAHLTYAVSQGDGFVEITGEVGTGKTTLCRSFLENLDASVVAAYIFNPKLDAVQLLKAINDEFGIDSTPHTVKELIDVLNAFLMECKGAGKKVLLLVDEAQNLGKDVLEQLRLLSNLETTRDKLLQIILVGQPELAEMLASHELRQLGQRITLSCRLSALTLTETEEYVLHRIAVAALRPGLKFDQAAIRRIHRYAAGVPRLINIAADRALLIAYGLNSHVITEEIVKSAIAELAGADRRGRLSWMVKRRMLPVGIGLACCGVAVYVVTVLFGAGSLASRPDLAATDALTRTTEAAVAGQGQDGPAATAGFRDFLAAVPVHSSRRAAFLSTLAVWDKGLLVRDELDAVSDDQTFFRLAGEQNGFMLRLVDDLDCLRALGLPAILEMRAPGPAQPIYLAVARMRPGVFTLRGGEREIEVGEAAFRSFWTGTAYVPWKNFLRIDGTIPRNAPSSSVLSFKMLLRDIGCRDVA